MPTGIYNRKPLSEEHKNNISRTLKGKMPMFIPNNKGSKRTIEQRKKISEASYRQFKNGMPEDTKKKIRNIMLSKSKILSKNMKEKWKNIEYRNRLVKAHTGKVSPLKGRVRTDMLGSKHPMWKNGRSKNRAYYRAKRRKLELECLGLHTFGEWELLKVQYNYTCPCCHKSEPEIKLTEDHIIPLSRGGSDNIENMQPLCKICNSKKHTKIIKY